MAMKRISDTAGKERSFHRYPWPSVLAAGLLLFLLAALFSFGAVLPASAAILHVAARPSISFSPSQGPVGAVIVVTGSGMFEADGTQVELGYAVNSNCVAPAGEQPGVIKNHAFSGWFRWPTTTGTGSFPVCVAVGGANPFAIGNYQVLSATPPQVSVAPTSVDAGKQATLTGANFLPAGTSVNLLWQTANGGSQVSLGTVTSDASGAFTKTFIAPSRSSTGSYSIVATAGSGQPPTLSATTTFHVNGITIVAVPTPVVHPSPTVAPTATPMVSATATAAISPASTSRSPNSGASSASNMSTILPVATGGLLLIVAALIGGVFVVRRQRTLAATVASGGSPWPNALAAGGGGMPAPDAAYRTGGLPPPDNPMLDRPTLVYEAPAPGASAVQKQTTIPFDPGLAEAMRQAQVSLFAMPRPPVGEKLPL
jgi:uncharacterized membrane protein